MNRVRHTNSTVVVGLVTTSDANGVAQDADSLPTVSLILHNGSPIDGFANLYLQVSQVETGVYTITVDTATALNNGYFLTQFFGWFIASVDGVVSKTPIEPFEFVLDEYVTVVTTDVTNTATTFAFSMPDWGSAADYAKNMLVRFISGDLRGQVRKCSAMSLTGPRLTVSEAFTGTPVAGDVFLFVTD